MKFIIPFIVTVFPILCIGQIKRIDIDSFELCKASKQISTKQLRIDDSLIRKNLIGHWQDQNSFFTFSRNGIMTTYWDDIKETTRHKWTIKNRVLHLDPSGIEPGTIFAYKQQYYVIYSSPKTLEFRYIDKSVDSTIWIAQKQPPRKN